MIHIGLQAGEVPKLGRNRPERIEVMKHDVALGSDAKEKRKEKKKRKRKKAESGSYPLYQPVANGGLPVCLLDFTLTPVGCSTFTIHISKESKDQAAMV